MWSHHLEELGNLWRLFVQGFLLCDRSKWTESKVLKIKPGEAVPCNSGVSVACSISVVLASPWNVCFASSLYSRDTSIAGCRARLQSCPLCETIAELSRWISLPSYTLFYIGKVQSKSWEVRKKTKNKKLINWKNDSSDKKYSQTASIFSY